MASYVVRVLPHEHALDVEMTIEPQPGPLVLETPTWLPGAYAFMRYGRDIVDVKAFDAQTGAPIGVVREGWNAIAVDAKATRVRVTYRAFVMDPAWGELVGVVDVDRAVLLGTLLFFVRGEGGSCRVTYEVPENWGFHHPSGAAHMQGRTYEYPDYATLLDTPVVAGTFDQITRDVDGTPFHFVFLERAIGFEKRANDLVDALVRVSRECGRIFGGFPFDDYTFVMSSDPRAHWGLEHANATMIGIGETVFIDPTARLECVRVAGHELFHAWNVKRLKPKPIVDLDLTRGSFTDALWIAEGFTRYYELLLAVRAREMTPERFFSNVVNYWRHLAMRPAYARTSVADSSRATFLNHHPYPGAWNSSIDYYDAGMLVAFDVDAVLRRSKSPSTLDDAFAAFYTEHVARGYTGTEARELFAKRDPMLESLLAREVEGAGALSTMEQLAALGFQVTFGEVPFFGIVLDKRAPGRIADVLDGSAAQKAGLAPDDEIVRLRGTAYHRAGFEWLVRNEEEIPLEVRRGGRLLTTVVRPGTRREVLELRWTGSQEDTDRLKKWLDRDDLAFADGVVIPLTAYDNFHGTDAAI